MTLLLGFAAVNTGNNLLYLLVSALLGFLTVSGFLGRGNLVGLRIELEWPEEIYAGAPSTATVRLENRKGWPAFLLRVEVAHAEAWFVTVGPRQVATEAVRVVFAGRGRHTQPGVRVYSPFPVNFFVRYVT
ncbi:MAG: hypothetical protein IH614_00810, partial [Desulfuromonadales bacterium]|nr:hypothetical protein [Desulfuromonadales bacterium]